MANLTDVENSVVDTENNNMEVDYQSNENSVQSLLYQNQNNVEQIKSDESLAKKSRNELLELYRNSTAYISNLESKLSAYEGEILSLKNTTDYQKHRDPSYREKILLRKLLMKEQEIQDYMTQMNELKASQIPSLTTLKSTLLDPAVNIIVQKLKNELNSTKASLEETQNELNAWKFTPDSNTGKRLMAKCRLLHQENEELGKMISSGRVAKLEGELALQKSFSEEVKKSQFELDELLQDLDEDVEGMQGTIYYLQQELKKSKEKVISLEAKNQELCTLLDNSRGQSAETNGINNNASQHNLQGVNNSLSTFNMEDESSNDSSCLILKVNPEEEYATMLNIDDETRKSNDNEENDYKNKRILDETFKHVPLKKQKRININQEFAKAKDSDRE